MSSGKDYLFSRMANFPQWSGMKHFNAVSTTEFSDGQAFYDILKVSDHIIEDSRRSYDLQISAFFPALLIFFPGTHHFYTASVPIFTTEFLSVSTA